MKTLTLIIEQIDDEDYDGNPTSYQRTTGTIAEPGELKENVHYVQSCPVEATEAQCKAGFEAAATDIGYTWDEVVVNP